MLVEAISPCKR